MKIVFNFKTALLAGLTLMLLGTGQVARAQGCTPVRDVLADFFRTSKDVVYRKVEISAADRARLQRRLGYAPARASYTFYVASSAGKVDGYALLDEENGEHLPITFAVKLSPAGTVERQEIVCYREARGDEVRDPQFKKQFVGKTARDPIAAGLDIVAVSGATISSRAMCVGVKRAVVLFEELLKPTVAGLVTAQPSVAGRPGAM